MKEYIPAFEEMPGDIQSQYPEFQSLNNFLNKEKDFLTYTDALMMYEKILLSENPEKRFDEEGTLSNEIFKVMYKSNRGANAVLNFLEEKYISKEDYYQKQLQEKVLKRFIGALFSQNK